MLMLDENREIIEPPFGAVTTSSTLCGGCGRPFSLLRVRETRCSGRVLEYWVVDTRDTRLVLGRPVHNECAPDLVRALNRRAA